MLDLEATEPIGSSHCELRCRSGVDHGNQVQLNGFDPGDGMPCRLVRHGRRVAELEAAELLVSDLVQCRQRVGLGVDPDGTRQHSDEVIAGDHVGDELRLGQRTPEPDAAGNGSCVGGERRDLLRADLLVDDPLDALCNLR